MSYVKFPLQNCIIAFQAFISVKGLIYTLEDFNKTANKQYKTDQNPM